MIVSFDPLRLMSVVDPMTSSPSPGASLRSGYHGPFATARLPHPLGAGPRRGLHRLAAVAKTAVLSVAAAVAVSSGMAASSPPAGEAAGAQEDYASLPLARLQSLQTGMQAELLALAHTSLNGGVGPIGYRSADHPDPEHLEWAEVDLGAEVPIDEIVLVPALARHKDKGFTSDAFPHALRIVAGTAENRSGTVVAEIPDTAGLLPRIAPLVVPAAGLRASWVRVEADRLSPRAFDGRYIFQLSELLVYSGEVNLALRRPLKVSSADIQKSIAWQSGFLVDGILPYLMESGREASSVAFVSQIGIGERPAIEIDLGQDRLVSGLRIHAVDLSDTAPQTFVGDFGLPRQFALEAVGGPAAAERSALFETGLSSIYQVGPIMEWQFQPATCRRIRLVAPEPYLFEGPSGSGTCIGFAEIEILDAGRNIAAGCPVSAMFGPGLPVRRLASLTDGRNFYGQILPVRQWLGELARRHDLEVLQPVVAAELTRRFSHQRTVLRWMSWMTVALVLSIGVLIAYYRVRGKRQEAMIRERIAANLHDELGANLHAIGLLGDMAKDAVDSPVELVDTVERIRGLTERTGAAARKCANMLAVQGFCDDVVGEMQRDSQRLLADLKHSITCTGGEALMRLTRRRRIDLYLFHKEALTNVIRHSGATEADTLLEAGRRQIRLVVTDNGRGLEGASPASLRRRARLMGAKIEVGCADGGGTRVVLMLKIPRFKLQS